jgi:hypothetical protein
VVVAPGNAQQPAEAKQDLIKELKAKQAKLEEQLAEIKAQLAKLEGSSKARATVTFTDNAPDHWLLRKLEPGARVLSDRDYIWVKVPDELLGVQYLLRRSDEHKQALTPQTIQTDKDVDVYLIILVKQGPEEYVNEREIGKLEKESWKPVPGTIEGTSPSRAKVVTKIFKKTYPTGSLIVNLKNINIGPCVSFAFK